MSAFFLKDVRLLVRVSAAGKSAFLHTSSSLPWPSEVVPVVDVGDWRVKADLSGHSPLSSSQKLTLWHSVREATRTRGQNILGACVSTPAEIELLAPHADFLYLPGAFSRQSDMLAALAAVGRPVVVERGVFVAPNDLVRLVGKLQGLSFAVVDCGTPLGYSQVVLDPRVLCLLQEQGAPFGVSLSDLYFPEGESYPHRPRWLLNPQFIDAFIKTAHVFGASFYVVKEGEPADLSWQDVWEKIKK